MRFHSLSYRLSYVVTVLSVMHPWHCSYGDNQEKSIALKGAHKPVSAMDRVAQEKTAQGTSAALDSAHTDIKALREEMARMREEIASLKAQKSMKVEGAPLYSAPLASAPTTKQLPETLPEENMHQAEDVQDNGKSPQSFSGVSEFDVPALTPEARTELAKANTEDDTDAEQTAGAGTDPNDQGAPAPFLSMPLQKNDNAKNDGVSQEEAVAPSFESGASSLTPKPLLEQNTVDAQHLLAMHKDFTFLQNMFQDISQTADINLKKSKQDAFVPLAKRYLEKYDTDPSGRIILYHMARTLFDQQYFKEALNAFARVYRGDEKGPSAPGALLGMAEVLTLQKQKTAAKKFLEKMCLDFEGAAFSNEVRTRFDALITQEGWNMTLLGADAPATLQTTKETVSSAM